MKRQISSAFLSDEEEKKLPRLVGGPPCYEGIPEKWDQAGEEHDSPRNIAESQDEEDPLDAYMEGINKIVREQELEPPVEKSKHEEQMEQVDNVENYISHMKKRIEAGQMEPQSMGMLNFAGDSDEEVYATARIVDRQLLDKGYISYDDDGGINMPSKGEMKLLDPVDHSKIVYRTMNKNCYKEHEETASMSEEMARKLRHDFNIHVSGNNVCNPCIAFGHFMFDERLLSVIRQSEFTEPTDIQKQAVPVALSGRDIVGLAETGGGKTGAFTWPMVVHVHAQRPYYRRGDGPVALIIAPSRELAQQLHSEAKKYCRSYKIKCALIIGGSFKGQQLKELRSSNVEVITATPGRLIALIRSKAIHLRNVSYLVFDEADKMFDLGFEPQVRSICSNIRPDVHLLLFSATFSEKIERLVRDFLKDPVRISIGDPKRAGINIDQKIIVLKDHSDKWDWLLKTLPCLTLKGSVLIFVSRKLDVDALANNLRSQGFCCGALHGDMSQQDRDAVFSEYKARKITILVSTDVAARGIDVKHITSVVNYDAAKNLDSHIHRVGRTGRAKEMGEAYTLLVDEDRLAGDLAVSLKSSDKDIPDDLLKLAMKNNRFRRYKAYMFKVSRHPSKYHQPGQKASYQKRGNALRHPGEHRVPRTFSQRTTEHDYDNSNLVPIGPRNPPGTTPSLP